MRVGSGRLSIEVGQLLIASWVNDINDVFSGLLGTALGAAALALAGGIWGGREQVGLGSRPLYRSPMALDLILLGFSTLKPFASLSIQGS